MSAQPSNNWRRRLGGIQILCGSTPKAVGATEDVLAARIEEDATPYTLRLVIDPYELPPADLAPPTVPYRPSGTMSFIPAVKPVDAASLQQAEEEGLITAPADGWTEHSRGAADNEGAGGNPREGNELARLNGRKIRSALHRLMQEAIAYTRRNPDLAKGRDPGSANGRLTIHIIVSTCGGMGTGSLIWFLRECIIPCAKENGIEPKIVVDLLCRGNLDTHDVRLAQINELTTLRALRALATGAYVDALTGRMVAVPFDQVRLFSNINHHGNFTSLKELVLQQSHLYHFLACTPAGSDLREREPDIANWRCGEFEDPRCGYTGSIAAIHWDRRRLLDCCQYLAAGRLLQSLLAEGDGERILSDAGAFATANSLVESSDQNQLTASISRPDELGGETVLARAAQSLAARVSSARGQNRANEAVQGIRNNDGPSVYEPQMRGKAQAIVAAAEKALAERLGQFLRKPEGIWETIKFLQLVLLILERSQKALTEKTNELQEYQTPHDQVLAEAAEQLQRFSEQGRWRRLVNFQQLRSITSALEQSGRAAIDYGLQIAACNTALQYVLLPLSDLLQRKLARLVSARQRFGELAQHYRNKANSRAEEPIVFEVPIGLEIVTPKYVGAWFTEHVDRCGGLESFIASLQGRFLEKYTSLAALADASFEEMEEVFAGICRTPFEPAAANTNVLVEFRRVFPEHAHQKICADVIGRGEGRLLMEGEVNKAIAWVKTANAPNAADTEWVAKLLEKADRKGGKWQVAAHPEDPETFSMVQFRGDVSLTPFINRLALPDTCETWQRLIPTAADPISAIAVGPNPTERQFRRVLAKAIACELLTVEDKGCLAFHSSGGEQWLLGKDAAAVLQKLQPRWSQLVYVETYFASELVEREAEVVAHLEQMKAALTAQEAPSDQRLPLIDVTAIDECLQQIDLLRPWARRLQKARRRIIS